MSASHVSSVTPRMAHLESDSTSPEAGRGGCRWVFLVVFLLATFSARPSLQGQALEPDDAARETTEYWRGFLETDGGSLPFDFSLHSVAEGQGARRGYRATFHNGGDDYVLDTVLRPRGHWAFRFNEYESIINAHYVDAQGNVTSEPGAHPRMVGTWGKARATGTVSCAFSAERTPVRQRFPPSTDLNHTAAFVGRWKTRFSKSDSDAVGIFEVNRDGIATGTFLTTTGDYRFLAGRVEGKTLELSCFDGAHAFLFRAQLRDDHSLQGDFWSAPTWHETWTAVKDPDASLADPWKQTVWKQSVSLADLNFPDLEGKPRCLAESEFQGSARLLYLFGSWCPNCHDASRFVEELAQRYAPRGLQVIGLAFEHSGDLEHDRQRVAYYAQLNKLSFPILIAGSSDKNKATESFGALDFVRAYPTFVLLNGAGEVEHIYSGFTGPAAAIEHQALRHSFRERLESMLSGTKTNTDSLRVMSYNIRYAAADAHPWQERLPIAIDLLQRYSPDVVGMQEVLWSQAMDLESQEPLSDYGRIALGREGGSDGEMMAVYYRRDRLRPLAFDHFWLSDTPEVVGSKSWQSSLPRMVTWVRFLDLRTQRRFLFANTHFDHRSQQAREMSAQLCVDRLLDKKGTPSSTALEKLGKLQSQLEPVILLGDFNAAAGASKPYSILTERFTDTWEVAQRRSTLFGTFHGYRPPTPQGSRIDWILVHGNWSVSQAQIITYQKNGEYPSDHFPVMVELTPK